MRLGRYKPGDVYQDRPHKTSYSISRILRSGQNEFLIYLKPLDAAGKRRSLTVESHQAASRVHGGSRDADGQRFGVQMRPCRFPYLVSAHRGDDVGVAVQVVEAQIELLDRQQCRSDAVMRLERQGQHAGQVAFRILQFLIGHELAAQPVQLGLDRLHCALDVFRIDAGPRRPHRAVAARLELARGVVGQPLPVADLRPESAHQAEPARG